MNRRDALRYSRYVLTKRGMLPRILLLSISFFWFLQGMISLGCIGVRRAQPAELLCYMPFYTEQAVNELKKQKNVLYVGEYRESRQELSYGSYSTEITLVGLEEDIFFYKFGEKLQITSLGAMPYLVLPASVLAGMKDTHKELFGEEKAGNSLGEILQIQEEKARVCALLEETGDGEEAGEAKAPCVYTTLNGYEKLTAKQGTSEIADEEGNTAIFCIGVKNSFDDKHLEALLVQLGITEVQDSEWVQNRALWSGQEAYAGIQLCMGLFGCLCMGLLFYYYSRLLCREYAAFFLYIGQSGDGSRNRKRFLMGVLLWHILPGILICGMLRIAVSFLGKSNVVFF